MKAADGFRRARHPEQIAARRAAILETATAMLAEMPVAEVSLNELSRRIGLAKSNVLRYFESREAILLQVLDDAWQDWLGRMEQSLAEVDSPAPVTERIDQVVERVVAELISSPLLCELISVAFSVLERNVATETITRFKYRMLDATTVAAARVRQCLPELTEGSATGFAAEVFVLTTAVWPLTHPPARVADALQDPNLAFARLDFGETMRHLLITLLFGYLARPADDPPIKATGN
ncbi:TetR/AcrR family transcriptional regulator [Nocardia arthritidis]|uniref:TetR family transcriptional regulator n=1 Tax=Nocardia arthritidis TaxID=228602 RepID=A0A6G9YBY2_9NOCA|nr:TetR family transcriptional regulator [Nocardia arthritidis]QIS10731.1 TetR family transcriptional regulator [Nocardia arthritidis]